MEVRVLKKVLIANRGEIAVRIIRTCREMGISTVAVYSELDRNALHVRLATRPTPWGPERRESYLNTAAISTSSSAAAPTPCTRATASTRRTPTSPVPSPRAESPSSALPPRRSRSWATRSPRVSPPKRPGGRGARAQPSPRARLEVVAFAEEFGWPVAIKAAYGGGGRGMKVVTGPDDAHAAFESAQREALSYFGRPSATSSATSPGRVTSRCRSSPTPPATPSGSASATAPPSAATEADRGVAGGELPRRRAPGHGRGRGEGRSGLRYVNAGPSSSSTRTTSSSSSR